MKDIHENIKVAILIIALNMLLAPVSYATTATSNANTVASNGGIAKVISEASSSNGGTATSNSDVLASGEGSVAECNSVAISDGSNVKKDCKNIDVSGKETGTFTTGTELKTGKTDINVTSEEIYAVGEHIRISKGEPKPSIIVVVIGKILRFLHIG